MYDRRLTPPSVSSARRDGDATPTELTAGLLCRKWKPTILRELSDGEPVRFNQLHARLTGVAHKVLTSALRDLERDGLVARRVVSDAPRHVEYRLTERGRALVPVIELMDAWGRRYLDSSRSDAH